MGHQNKALLGIEIFAHQLPAPDVQVVGGFVDEQKVVFLQEEDRQLQLCPFAVGKGSVRPPEDILGKLQQVHFPLQLPVLVLRINILHHRHGKLFLIGHSIGEIGEFHGSGDAALIGEFPQQQV